MSKRPCFAPLVCGRHEDHEHEHVDERCSEDHLGISGCPGDGRCEDWIEGAYRAGEVIREVFQESRLERRLARARERNK